MGMGAKLMARAAAAGDAAKAAAARVAQMGTELAKAGAGKALSAGRALLDSDVAMAAAGLAASSPVGAAAVAGAKLGYDYAAKGDLDYKSADPFGDQSLQRAAVAQCGKSTPAIMKREKQRRRRERERMIEAGKSSNDPRQRKAAEDLERDMVGVERARLSADVYREPSTPPIGVAEASPDELRKLGIGPGQLAPRGSSFRARVYKVDPEVMKVPPEYVMAFRGTVTKEDWAENAKQAVGAESDHYTRAIKLAQKLADSGHPVAFSGHSLGGGMASAAAAVTGMEATTQNSAGLNDKTVARVMGSQTPKALEAATRNVNAYRINAPGGKAELLTSLNKLPGVPDSVGKGIDLSEPRQGVSRFGLHGIDAVIDSIEQQKSANQQLLSPR